MENEILARVRELCAKRNWSVYRLALESGIGQTTLSNLFKRNNVPTIATLERICAGFGITLSQFFAYGKEATPYLSDDQLEFVRRYTELTPADKAMLKAYLSGLESKAV
jgi:transcriptional regulator with XRE-family HTH domain